MYEEDYGLLNKPKNGVNVGLSNISMINTQSHKEDRTGWKPSIHT